MMITTTTTTSKRKRKRPVPPPPVVVDEDSYSNALSYVIKRDFFPLQHRISEQQRKQFNLMTRHNDDGLASSPATATSTQRSGEPVVLNVRHLNGVTLNEFLNTFTSEDNASYEELAAQDEEKRRQKLKYICDAERKHNEQLLITHPDSGGSGGGSGAPKTWAYKARNALMYVPHGDDVEQEVDKHQALIAAAAVPPKQTIVANTRFRDTTDDHELMPPPPLPPQSSSSSSSRVVATPAGYRLMPAPSLTPGVNASPIITWGDVVGTPVHLRDEDAVVAAGSSSSSSTPPPKPPSSAQFRMPAASDRDKLTRQLAEKAQSRKQHRARGSGIRSPFHRRHTPLSATGLDAQLRSSYSPRVSTPRTPLVASGSSSSSSSRSNTPIHKKPRKR